MSGSVEETMSEYFDVYRNWKNDPIAFWAEAAEAIDWIKPPEKIFDPTWGSG